MALIRFSIQVEGFASFSFTCAYFLDSDYSIYHQIVYIMLVSSRLNRT